MFDRTDFIIAAAYRQHMLDAAESATNELKKQAFEAAKAGMSITAIAKTCSITRTTAYAWIAEFE